MGQPAQQIEAFRHLGESSAAQSHVGRTLGDYRLMQLIGEGGMGWIYQARHARIGRRVAIKMLRPELHADPVAVRRFFEEARAVNRIQHENIVQVHDFVENEDGATYLVLELLDGRDLLAALEGAGGPLPLERSLDVMLQVARALAEVHACGVVHRDLKPENIFLVARPGQTDLVKLLDFGIAKLRGGSNGRITKAGTSLGTPDYIAPEQALGADVDQRADIYSFGVILYELVTGRRPFASEDVTLTIARQVTEVPLRPAAVRPLPRALDDLVMACLAKRPDERPQTMGEVEARLRAVTAQAEAPGAIELELGVEPGEPGDGEQDVAAAPRTRPWLRPRRVMLAGALVLAVVAAAVALRDGSVETPAAEAGALEAAAETAPSLPPRDAPVTTTAAVRPPAVIETATPPKKPKRVRPKKQPARPRRQVREPGHSDVLPVYQD